jgi:LPS sulfotransferase NodH
MNRINKLLCIVAGQRSGTTALRSALAATGRFQNFGELFHTEELAEGSYLKFAQQRDLKVVDIATDAKARGIARDYVDYLFELAGPRLPMVDVKHNSWYALRPFWGYVHQIPFFMDVLIERGGHFLFIRRRDLVAQLLSEQIARAASKWHGLKAGDVKGPIEVDLAATRNQGRLILQAENLIWSTLKPRNCVVAIEYEELFVNGAVNPRLMGHLGRAFGVRLPQEIIPSISKNEGSLPELVRNYGEVKAEVDELVVRYGRFPLPPLADEA